jgi:hypothetical protein
MSSIKYGAFDNSTRIGSDATDLSTRSIQSMASANYMLNNFFSQDCNMSRPIEFATSQPNVFFKGGNQVGAGGCNIDENSDLLIGTINTHPKCKISLLERPFKTVPYLGRGQSNPVLESNIQQGDVANNKKSINPTTERSFIPYSNYPLLPHLETSITNPANLVEGVASDGWIRGGIPSRELQKDADYITNHTKGQY